ncbi:hypothetical protein EL22_28990 [Halostagnicola sp. A56]|uniref:hypothetical protein n=1 Tax=Halostagnicola sp. A56 TaxID=1495067 RepID=UPI00065F6B1A|nr:hypothetical protein [Halostagnicola sp. A56]KMT45635.1 hypothetical protein EL22_28990 [Halostagnicola sp. A56]
MALIEREPLIVEDLVLVFSDFSKLLFVIQVLEEVIVDVNMGLNSFVVGEPPQIATFLLLFFSPAISWRTFEILNQIRLDY